MVITAMYREASARKLNWMSLYLRFWSQKVHQKHTGNLGSPYPKDFWAGPINLSELPGQDAHISVHRKQEIIRKILTHLELYMVRSSFHRRAPPKNFWFDSHTVKSRTPRTTSTQILTTLSMTISPDSKTGQRWKRDWYAGIPCLGQLEGRTTLTPHHHCVVSSVKLNHDCPITHHSVF